MVYLLLLFSAVLVIICYIYTLLCNVFILKSWEIKHVKIHKKYFLKRNKRLLHICNTQVFITGVSTGARRGNKGASSVPGQILSFAHNLVRKCEDAVESM